MSNLRCAKNVIKNLSRASAFDRSSLAVDRCTASAEAVENQLWKTPRSSESFKKITDQVVEISVSFPQILDLPDRVNHGRMMLSSEAAADLGQRRVRQRFTQIHRDLPRHRHRLRVVPRFKLDHLQVVVVSDEFLNRLDR